MYKKSLEWAGLFFLPGFFFLLTVKTLRSGLCCCCGEGCLGCRVRGHRESVAWAVRGATEPWSLGGTPGVSPRGSLFGESSCAVISGACSSEVLGWEKQPLIRRGPGLHPASRTPAPAGGRDGGGLEGWPPGRLEAAVSPVLPSLCRAFWSGIARFPTKHGGPTLVSLSP